MSEDFKPKSDLENEGKIAPEIKPEQKLDLKNAEALLEEARKKRGELKQIVSTTTFSKKDYQEILEKEKETLGTIKELGQEYEEQLKGTYFPVPFEYDFGLSDIKDDLFVLEDIYRDKNFNDEQAKKIIKEIFDLEWDIKQDKESLEKPELSEETRSEIQAKILDLKNVLNTLVEQFREPIEERRTILINELAESYNQSQMDRFEERRRLLQSSNDRIKKYKKIISEIKDKITDPIILAKIKNWEEREEFDKIVEEINQLSLYIESRNSSVERVAEIQDKIIENILSLMQISEQEKEELRQQIFSGHITRDVNEIRMQISGGIVISPKKIKMGDVIPWRTGGKIGERYYDLLNFINENPILESELDILRENMELEIGEGRTVRGEYKKVLDYRDYVDTIGRTNKALTFILGKEQFVDSKNNETRKGQIYAAVEYRDRMSEEEHKELIEKLRLENEMRIKQEEERRISKEAEEKEKAELFAQQLEKIKEMGGFEHNGLYLIPNVVIPKRGVNKGKKGITFRAFSVNEDSKTIQEVNHITRSFLQPGINYLEEDIPIFSHLFKE